MDIWLIVCCLAPVWKYSYKGASPLPARNFRPLLGIFDFCGRRDFYRASPAVTLCLCSYLLWHCASAVTFCDTVPLRLPAVTLCLCGYLLWHCASGILPSLIRGTVLSSRLVWQTRGAEDLLYTCIANPCPDKENSWHLELLKDVSVITIYHTGFCWCYGHWIPQA